MGTQVSNPPLFCKLTAIHFNPIEELASYIGKIQEGFRLLGYPDYRNPATFRIELAGKPQIQNSSPRWTLGDAELDDLFIIEHNRIVYMTTNYKTIGDFVEKAVAGIRIINEVVGLSFIQKVGVRTVDVILPSEGKTPSDYLNGQLDGFRIVEGDLVQKMCETVVNTNGGILICRALQSAQGISLAPGLEIEPLTPQEKFISYDGTTGTLDLDHYAEKRSKYDPENIAERILQAHKVTSSMFYKSISDTAREEWGFNNV